MEKIASFTVNHLKLDKGLYVSRYDEKNGVTVTTFDLRFRKPNVDKVMEISAVHTIEHLGASFLRNSHLKNDVVYFGPMGCRTGFYLVLFGKLVPENIFDLILDTLNFIIGYKGEIIGATAIECGNYKDQNLPLAKEYCIEYLKSLLDYKNFMYKN